MEGTGETSRADFSGGITPEESDGAAMLPRAAAAHAPLMAPRLHRK